MEGRKKEGPAPLPQYFVLEPALACPELVAANIRDRAAAATDPSVVMVTMVYQNASGMLVNVVPWTFFSA